ncbi:MAG: hypothetical protein RL607_518 [Bacteroidota bacterium]|jgi:unsaturated rhamnogalacturonyl hydrolase
MTSFLIYLFGVGFFSFLGILIIDFIPLFLTWQSRIKIGSITDQSIWKSKMTLIACSWLHKTPVAKVTDQTRLIIVDMLRGNYKKNSIQSWQKAALVLGLTSQYQNQNNQEIKVHLDRFLASIFDENGNWKSLPKEVDEVMMAHACIQIPWLNKDKYRPAFDQMYALILELKGVDGTVNYRRHTPLLRFVDTLGFICPFLVHYGTIYNVPEAIDLSVLQLQTYQKYGLMVNRAIPCHTYRTDDKQPVGLFGWGRGLGWYAYGLLDTYLALPESHSAKSSFVTAIQDVAKDALLYQKENGSWSWLLFNSSANSDSSITAIMAWYLSVMPEELQTEQSKNASKNASKYLQNVTRRNGVVDFSQGDTKGVGVYAQTFDILPFTQGFVLRCKD